MDWASERDFILRAFLEQLRKPTKDGSAKRQGGLKPPWYKDGTHEAAIFSHLMKWKKGEKLDPESGAHPLVHAAWRCLAIACIETGLIPKDGPTTTPSRASGHNQAETGGDHPAERSTIDPFAVPRPEN